MVGLGGEEDIADVIKNTLTKKKTIVHLADATGDTDDSGRLLLTPAHWAYLRISEGCDRRCAFCTIPTIRGRFKSKPLDAVVNEAKELAQNGATELSIIAQDSNYYGRDLGEKNGLVKLLKQLEQSGPLKSIRLM